jgi:hypothetical protein
MSPFALPAQPELQKWIETIDAVYREELARGVDWSGLATRLIEIAGGWHVEELRAAIRDSAEWHDRHDPRPRPPIDRRDLRGAFCIPTRPRRVWWPAYLGGDEAEQDRYITDTVDRHYTFGQVLVSGLPYGTDYPEIAPDAGRLRAGLEKIRAAGLVTIVAFDDRRGADLSYLRDVLVPNRDLIDWSMGIYEVNGVLKDPALVLSVLRQTRELLPDALSAVHFEPLDEGRQSYGLVDWHRAQREAGLNALFFQSAGWEVGVAEATNRIHDFTRRLMGGFHGYPVLSHGVYDYENTTSKTYRYQMTEADAVAFTDHVMNAPLPLDEGVAAIRPSGFCDLGTP